MKKTALKAILLVLCLLAIFSAFFCGWFIGAGAKEAETAPAGSASSFHIPVPDLEYLVGSAVYQLAPETDALILQGYATVRGNVERMLLLCADETRPDWQLVQNAAGENEMYHNGVRVAIITDIDDTLVNGVNYTADILGNGGDWNNAAFARFIMSDGCTALPGAVECITFCRESGIEVFYVTNRYDQGYKVGQKDSRGSYEEYRAAHGEGTYTLPDGTLVGTSVYELYGMSMYDITLASMQKLGFPIDDAHLFMNDLKVYGDSKERVRLAIAGGSADCPNGQRENENSLGTRSVVSCEPHEIVMLLGDQLSDFTDGPVSGRGTSFAERKKAAEAYSDHFGKDWILFPNAVYGTAIDVGIAEGPEAVFKAYAYTVSAGN